MKKKHSYEDDGKTHVGMRIERTTADLFRDALKLGFILAVFLGLLSLLATCQYVVCLKADPDAGFTACMTPHLRRR